MMYRDLISQTRNLIDVLGDLGRKYGKSVSQISLNWVMCKGLVPIPGCKTAKQARDNAGALGWRLSSDDVALLDKTSEPIAAKNRAGVNLDSGRVIPEI